MVNKYICSILMILVVVSMLGLVSGEILVSDAGVEYDSEILKGFENQTFVPIFMELNDISKSDELLSNFLETEFKFIRKSPRRIVGEITKEGFNRLINDSRVKVVYFSTPVHGTDSENQTINKTDENINKTDYSEINKEVTLNLFWIVGIVFIIFVILYVIIIYTKK